MKVQSPSLFPLRTRKLLEWISNVAWTQKISDSPPPSRDSFNSIQIKVIAPPSLQLSLFMPSVYFHFSYFYFHLIYFHNIIDVGNINHDGVPIILSIHYSNISISISIYVSELQVNKRENIKYG